MASVSSESLAKALEFLEPKLAQASVDLPKDLFAVLEVLDANAGLRRALTDPAREAAAKAGLLAQLLRGKVSADAEAIVAELASYRWSSERDISDALETLAVTAVTAVAEQQDGASGLAKLEQDLFSFIEVVRSNHELQRALDEAQAPAEAKSALALKLVPNASRTSKVLIQQAVAAPRGLKPMALVERFVELVAKRQQRWIATVTSSVQLSETQLQRLQQGLNKFYARELNLNTSIDPKLVGGLVVKVGDEVVDASVASRVADLRRALAS
ncbi:F0F1 ATP synthase subunit delta [Arthrobacter sp. MYb211]|uniref:F0F1 ATP synthase subunit delta n=1 Tax=Micrococcaceae TaxID=1268 RepID=UPI000CFAFB28|nr:MULTISPECIES: F0F1 ATP synthase subunit delta [unclassified Arthrobacter]PQZ97116.1 F0F1 ATP synthase subunit delta [Arthrobacter sp. MYb224]PRA00022.1 F0F1 ATP synthase subunit delta [Arthrobacter sp. MYb229]PRA08405.1 F0F1 ATP synthase subunit delta [Arthrobacter sp. MYb221]PRB48304.1 F0F1 ATP synthase subunit delta [Arthrobacter sp. MYb216]PRC03888.1 F0F1 ATP synthase subunit delta [Arthrobacter sp. MYb211]